MSARIIDTHCHIQTSQYDADRDEVIKRAQHTGTGIVIVGCDYMSSVAAIKIAENIGSGAWASVGLQPVDSRKEFDCSGLVQLGMSSSKVVAVGETGLDWHFLAGEDDIQQEKGRQLKLFTDNISLAKELGKPLIIHSRDAHKDIVEILRQSYGQWNEGDQERGVLHCFTGTLDEARQYLKLGFLISFTGIITFAQQYDEVVREVPLEKLLIETDAPFLAPIPFRGKRNEPAYVEYVARRIAEIKECVIEKVEKQTTNNAKRLFQLS